MMLRALPLLLLLSACADFPEVGQAIARSGPATPTPALLPMEQITTPAPRAEARGDALSARVAALRARAAALRAR